MRLFFNRYRLFALAIFTTLLIDQLSKYFALGLETSDPVSQRYFIVTVFEKLYKMAGVHLFLINVRHYFVMHQLMVRVIVLPVIGFYIFYYLIRKEITSKWVFLGIGLMIGAFLGNAVDIVFRGYVVDWFGLSFFMKSAELNFAINFADMVAVISAPFILFGIRRAEAKIAVATFDPNMNVTVDNAA